jgi:hypothetical protein
VGSEPKIPRDFFVIDEAVRNEYRYIEAEDTCVYVWERMSRLWREGERPDYDQYPVNGLISNLQILPSFRISHPRRYYWKGKAINYAAKALGTLLTGLWREHELTYVPIPPSKLTADPEYDERLMNILRAVRPALTDIRPLVFLSGEGFDAKQKGLRPLERAAHYSVDEDCAEPEPKTIVLFDDVLTTGCHFKAMESVLKSRFPAEIIGLFLARTVRPPDDADDLLISVLG